MDRPTESYFSRNPRVWCHSCRKYERGDFIPSQEVPEGRLLICKECHGEFVEIEGQNVEAYLSPSTNATTSSSSTSSNFHRLPHFVVEQTEGRYPTHTSQILRPTIYRYPTPSSTGPLHTYTARNPTQLTLGIDALRLVAHYQRLIHSLSRMGGQSISPPHLDEGALARLPRITVSADTDTEALGGLCSICQEPFVVGDTLVRLHCGHTFKEAGIIPWLRTHDTCPVCRTKIHEESTQESVTSENVSSIQLDDYSHHVGVTPLP